MKSIFLLTVLISSINIAFAEAIELKLGEIIEGIIIERTDEYIKVDTGVACQYLII